MNAGERVDLLKKLSNRLAEREWSEIDLVLRQFGLPWSDRWNGGDRAGYCVHHLENGTDEALAELGQYLFEGASEATAARSSEIWKPDYFRLFLTHSNKEKKLVACVKDELQAWGIDGFVAHKDIQPTKEWVTEIELALSTCHALAAFLSDGFHESNWTDQEIGYCVARRVLIIPIRLAMDPYGFIQRYQALTPDDRVPRTIATALAKTLSASELTASRMGPAIVRRFEESCTFAEARSRMDDVEAIRSWTPEMLRALQGAAARNSQIRGSWGVAERVRALIERHSR